ncbi:hypothetical protein [uncultured Bacteroides sp.]|uniref:WD40/YVTN/BNR-like repeat-containing protein n=1 Tax=uncultured Bacteroides sp. TaxID=162156 RepID=UPI002AA95BE9|nr:hypothetical protein [uncultured Bacteroides sp.]
MRIMLTALAVSLFLCSCSDNDANKLTVDKTLKDFQYIGLKEKTGIREAQDMLLNKYGTSYSPSMQIIDDFIYVTTSSGIYRKRLDTSNSAWVLYAFENMPVTHFIKKGSDVLAITACSDERAFILSSDDGKTYKTLTPASFVFKELENKVVVSAIAQNPRNPNSLLALVVPVGVVQSTDFGQNWKCISTEIGGGQNWFVGYNPNDTTNIYNTGESMIMESLMYSSLDAGKNWQLIESMNNSCIHHIAFHPSDPNTMIYSGEYIVKKSTDRGRSWSLKLVDEIYFYKVVYDKDNPSIVYASGCTRIPNEFHKFTIYRSTDGGDNWHVFFQTNLSGEGGIIDFELYKSKLYLYTYADGIYTLDTQAEE